MRINIASAEGFHREPKQLSAAVRSLPNFHPKQAVSDGRRTKGEGLYRLVEEVLARNVPNSVVNLECATREEFGVILSTRIGTERVNDFDLLTISWSGNADQTVIDGFVRICRAAVAEFGVLDGDEHVKKYASLALPAKLHYGIPALGWVNWFGPQLATHCPGLVKADCWRRLDRQDRGYVAVAAETPDLAMGVVDQLATCVGRDAFYPRAVRIPFDLKAKNALHPEWLNSPIPPRR